MKNAKRALWCVGLVAGLTLAASGGGTIGVLIAVAVFGYVGAMAL